MPLFFTKKLFDSNVMIDGERGTGKDMLFSNVIARRRAPYYISPVDYKITNKIRKKRWIRLDLNKLMTNNRYNNFITGNFVRYYYPYKDKIDIYLPDCGVYFPAQYCNELNRDYKDLPTFIALSRHLGECNVHCNTQSLNRVWDKLREQSSTYIHCLSCKVICGYVFQRIRIYERYDSALQRIAPFTAPFTTNKETRSLYNAQRVAYRNQHGFIKEKLLIYKNKSAYNTRYFRDILEKGENYEKDI